MFTLHTKDCLIFKNSLQILKTDVMSVRAKGGVVFFSLHNRSTGLMLLHKVKAEVKREQEFGVATDRFITLLSKDELELDFNGSTLSYKSGRSKGVFETVKPYFEDWPSLKETGVPVQTILDEFSFIDLKSKHHIIYVFGGTVDGTPAVACGDRDHAVFLPLQKSSEFGIPLSALHSARRLFKDNVKVLVEGGTVYFQSRSEKTMSILRIGQMGDTDRLNLQLFQSFRLLTPLWTATVESALITSMLKDYEAIRDPERDGAITIEIKGGTLTMTCKTRHGEVSLSDKATGDDASVDLNTDLLKDIHKLEGPVKIGVKEGGRVFFIENQKGMYFSAVR